MEQKQKRDIPRIRERVADRIHLSQDILAGAMIVTTTGMHQVMIENYKGILEYTGDSIRVQGKQGRISILGSNLVIQYYTDDEMVVTGQIDEVKYNR